MSRSLCLSHKDAVLVADGNRAYEVFAAATNIPQTGLVANAGERTIGCYHFLIGQRLSEPIGALDSALQRRRVEVTAELPRLPPHDRAPRLPPHTATLSGRRDRIAGATTLSGTEPSTQSSQAHS